MIRSIFFDLDGTLFNRVSVHHRYYLDLVDRYPEVFSSPERVAELLEFAGRSAHLDIDHRTVGRRIADRFPELGRTGTEIARDHAIRIADFVEPEPGTIRLMATLSKRYRLAIVSNGSGRVQRAKLARLGLGAATPQAFISGEVGAAKPDPALFETALARTNSTACETLFVGDDPEKDIAGAANLGMTTCWVSGGRPYPAQLPRPHMTIDYIYELREPGE